MGNKDIVERSLIGTTQIVDAHGNVMSSIRSNDNDDYIIEEMVLKQRAILPVPDRYWIPNLREEYITAWQRENALGRKIYNEKRGECSNDHLVPIET